MFSVSSKTAFLFFSLCGLSAVAAQPVDDSALSTSPFTVFHNAGDFFPHAKGNMSAYDLGVEFSGYNSSMKSWLTSIDPAVGATDEQKAEMLLSVAYAKPFDQTDEDMTNDRDELLATVAGNTTALAKRAEVTYRTASTHAVVWSVCSGAMSCIAGYSCTFNTDIGKAPRSKCQAQGGQNCCVSWSSYTVKVGFFQRTWTNCNSEVTDEGMTKASCEGHGSSSQGGDVCLSNRATGCT